MNSEKEQQRNWYVLNYVPTCVGKSKIKPEEWVRRFSEREKISLSIFAPTFISYVERNGTKQRVNLPLTFQYVFMHGSFADIKKFCSEPNGFSFVLDRTGDHRYAIVSDKAMDDFKRLAARNSNRVPFYPLDGIDLQEGDYVEVMEGDFPGLKGYYFPYPKSNSGRLVLRLSQSLGTVAYDIKARYVRVLEFARNSRRSYDYIDAFVPVLYGALRKYALRQPLDEKENGLLVNFCRRMGRCRLDNHKIEARLCAMLMAANAILGDSAEEKIARDRLDKRMTAVTSAVTKAFILLLEAVIDEDRVAFLQGRQLMSEIDKKSAATDLLRSEYDYFASLQPEKALRAV